MGCSASRVTPPRATVPRTASAMKGGEGQELRRRPPLARTQTWPRLHTLRPHHAAARCSCGPRLELRRCDRALRQRKPRAPATLARRLRHGRRGARTPPAATVRGGHQPDHKLAERARREPAARLAAAHALAWARSSPPGWPPLVHCLDVPNPPPSPPLSPQSLLIPTTHPGRCGCGTLPASASAGWS